MKIKSVRVGDRVFTVDGESPLRYVDLKTNKVHVYGNPKPLKHVKSFKFTYKEKK